MLGEAHGGRVGAASGTAGAGWWLLQRDSANPVEMNI